MIKLLQVGLIIVCVLAARIVVADDVADLYQIEVIIFENTDPKRFNAENWPKFVGEFDTRNAINLKTLKRNLPDNIEILETLESLDEVGEEPIKTIIPDTVSLVDQKHLIMPREAQTIKNSKTQRFIQYVGWNQPLSANVKSTPILVEGGKNGKEVEAIFTVKPTRGVYAVDIDLVYHSDQDNKSGVKDFRVKREVKVKRKEPFFVDHPIIGMIVLVTPVITEY